MGSSTVKPKSVIEPVPVTGNEFAKLQASFSAKYPQATLIDIRRLYGKKVRVNVYVPNIIPGVFVDGKRLLHSEIVVND